jgi:hypothetical protein
MDPSPSAIVKVPSAKVQRFKGGMSMAYTDNRDLYAAVNENGINLVAQHAMRQRPSWFNYATQYVSDHLAAFDTSLHAPATSATGTTCSCQGEGTKADTPFEVNPKGYAVFHVSAGAGGYAVRVSKAAEDPRQQNPLDSRELKGEDIFSAVILRPGTYSASNSLNAKAKGKITVGYPKIGKTPYRPPSPASIVCSAGGFEPSSVELQPGQAVLFQAAAPSRITRSGLEKATRVYLDLFETPAWFCKYIRCIAIARKAWNARLVCLSNTC